MADTAGAAWALARYAERQADLFCPRHGQRDALASLPVEGLRLEAPILETFLKLGLRRIGDLYPLPRAPLARRFGDLPLTRLDQALGALDETDRAAPPAPAFRTRLAFAEPISRPEDIAAATSRLLAALCRQFEQAGVGARKLEIALYRVDGSADRTAIGTSRPNRDNPKLMKLFEEKLGELDPGFGVELMILAAPEVEAWTGTQDALPEAGALARLAGGGRHDRSRRPAGAAPGRGERGAPAAARQPSARARAGRRPVCVQPAADGAWRRLAALKGARPTRLLQRPEPVEVTAFCPTIRRVIPLAPACPPHRARRRAGADRRRMVAAAARRQPTCRQHVPPVRDYYRVEDEDGGRFWLFRDGPTARRQRPADGALVPPRILRLGMSVGEQMKKPKSTLTIRGLD